MNLKEAYSVLELTPNASAEDVKKSRTKLMKKYHPDVNKDLDAEAKFKRVNEAYELIQKGEESPQNIASSGFNINDFMNGATNRSKKRRTPEIINLKAHLSFKDAVFGCKRDFTYERYGKCEDCNGQGSYTLHNGCTECQGRGVTITRQGNMVMQQTCGKCSGKTQTEQCKNCSGYGGIKSSRSISVTVPGGVKNGNSLRLEGMGNFVEVVNSFFGSGEAYTDAFVQLQVSDAEFNCTLKDNNLHTTLNISLLEALKGCTKMIETLDGNKEIKIAEKTKNSQQVIIPNLGVSRTGNQIVDINVDYPQDIESLINHLSK